MRDDKDRKSNGCWEAYDGRCRPSSVDLIARTRGRATADRLKHESSRDPGEQSKPVTAVYGFGRRRSFTPTGVRGTSQLPGDALIAFVFVDRFNRRILLTNRCVDPVPERWSARGHQARRRGRFAQGAQDVAGCV